MGVQRHHLMRRRLQLPMKIAATSEETPQKSQRPQHVHRLVGTAVPEARGSEQQAKQQSARALERLRMELSGGGG